MVYVPFYLLKEQTVNGAGRAPGQYILAFSYLLQGKGVRPQRGLTGYTLHRPHS